MKFEVNPTRWGWNLTVREKGHGVISYHFDSLRPLCIFMEQLAEKKRATS